MERDMEAIHSQPRIAAQATQPADTQIASSETSNSTDQASSDRWKQIRQLTTDLGEILREVRERLEALVRSHERVTMTLASLADQQMLLRADLLALLRHEDFIRVSTNSLVLTDIDSQQSLP